ncbi:MAG: hypothetical protein GAK30_03692 [Paracidovorax wautersii]|uniref:Uncharacterized protein n=1 Tax=Paracidovorax wautersii TaxID=1177982 RepID=A0A7V8JNU7_9BURK|nr:MAG: hypothetical protein GAK30_03692 [Paracidovorax wautersii]
MLPPASLQAKQAALQMFQTQLHDDPSTGANAILSAATVERLLQPFEVLFV